MVLGKLFISRGGGIATSPKKGTYQQFHACQKLWPKVPINYVEVEVPSVRRDRRLLKHHLLCYIYVCDISSPEKMTAFNQSIAAEPPAVLSLVLFHQSSPQDTLKVVTISIKGVKLVTKNGHEFNL